MGFKRMRAEQASNHSHYYDNKLSAPKLNCSTPYPTLVMLLSHAKLGKHSACSYPISTAPDAPLGAVVLGALFAGPQNPAPAPAMDLHSWGGSSMGQQRLCTSAAIPWCQCNHSCGMAAIFWSTSGLLSRAVPGPQCNKHAKIFHVPPKWVETQQTVNARGLQLPNCARDVEQKVLRCRSQTTQWTFADSRMGRSAEQLGMA